MATDSQVQIFVNGQLRPRCEQIRKLLNAMNQDIAEIDDVYNALIQPNTTWSDKRTDGPPHLLTANDVLAINQFLHDIRDAIRNNPQLPIVLRACVRESNT